MQTIGLAIEGIHCESCAARLKALLEREPGVREASVSFADGAARVRYNEHAVSEDRLVELVERGGYSAAAERT